MCYSTRLRHPSSQSQTGQNPELPWFAISLCSSCHPPICTVVFRLSKSTTALSSSRLRSGSASNWTKLPNQASQTLIPLKDDGIKTDTPFQRIEAAGRESNHKRNLHYEVTARNVGARMRSRMWRGANRPSREIQSVLLPWKRCTQ